MESLSSRIGGGYWRARCHLALHPKSRCGMQVLPHEDTVCALLGKSPKQHTLLELLHFTIDPAVQLDAVLSYPSRLTQATLAFKRCWVSFQRNNKKYLSTVSFKA